VTHNPRIGEFKFGVISGYKYSLLYLFYLFGEEKLDNFLKCHRCHIFFRNLVYGSLGYIL
jgi:hypothetical protein